MTEWHLLPLGSTLNAAPSVPVGAPVIGKLELLPFNALSWEDFERLQWRVMHDVEGLRHAQLYGDRGQAQYGIDIVALAPDGVGVALQSKKYKRFGAAEIRSAVNKFRTTDRPFSVDRLIIGVARTVRSTQAIEELAEQQKKLQPVSLELWDEQRLSYLLRGRPDIVIEFFGMPTAEAFCLPFKLDVTSVPTAEVVAIREAMGRTPEVTTGAQQDFDDAAATTDPAEALLLIEAGQAKLRDAGFSPHAAQHDEHRIRLLARIDRAPEAARSILDDFWAALDQGLSATAQMTQSRLDELSRLTGKDGNVESYRQIGEVGIQLYLNPVAYVPEIDSLRIGDSVDQVRLALLAGETALCNDDTQWLSAAVPAFTELSGIPSIDRVLRTRLRLLLAEATSDWSELLGDARKLKLGHDLLGLVTARYARHCALTEKFQEADLAWEEASGSATLARQWDEASTWIFSRRAFRSHWNPFTSNELLPLQIAIREMGTSLPIVPVASSAYVDSLAALSDHKLRSAAISAQRALRDAVTTSDWAGEDRARRALASILIESDEPLQAARHLARAGAAKAIETLGNAHPREFINVTDDLDAPNYWTVGTTYRLLATQADVIPDDVVGSVSEKMLAELAAAETGSKPDLRAFATSRYNNAVKALAGVADRLDADQASRALSHFEQQPPVDANHYRYHDEDEAIVVAKVALTHPRLAARAVPHLVNLLGRSQVARNSITLDAIGKTLTLADETLKTLADAGNSWASEMLSFEASEDLDADVTADALARLTTPLAHSDGVYTVGTNAVGDSLLVRRMPMNEVDKAMTELLIRADDPHVSSGDRCNYLIAATNLSSLVDRSKRPLLFDTAVRLATSPTPSDHDKLNEQFTHKLGGFRINGPSHDSRGQAVLLAATLADDDNQKSIVRRLAYSLLGEESDYWPTRALQHLGNTVRDDLAFLASQGWAIRSLAARLWVEFADPAHLGNRLAADSDVRVRRALARALAQEPETSHPTVREQLARDPAYSVRTALKRVE